MMTTLVVQVGTTDDVATRSLPLSNDGVDEPFPTPMMMDDADGMDGWKR